MKNKNQITLKFLLVGFVFGLLFPTIAIVADCFIFNDIPVAFSHIWNRLNENPIHFIILTAPIILGGTFYAIGWFAQDQKKLNDKLTKTNNVMKETNELLDTFNYHVSHDLKTVLNNQLALSKMARKYTRQKNWEKLESGLLTILTMTLCVFLGFYMILCMIGLIVLLFPIWFSYWLITLIRVLLSQTKR